MSDNLTSWLSLMYQKLDNIFTALQFQNWNQSRPNVRTDYLTERSGGFDDGVIGLDDVHEVKLPETALQGPARHGYIYCTTGQIELIFNQGEIITMDADDYINLDTNRQDVFEIQRILIRGKKTSSSYRLFLW